MQILHCHAVGGQHRHRGACAAAGEAAGHRDMKPETRQANSRLSGQASGLVMGVHFGRFVVADDRHAPIDAQVLRIGLGAGRQEEKDLALGARERIEVFGTFCDNHVCGRQHPIESLGRQVLHQAQHIGAGVDDLGQPVDPHRDGIFVGGAAEDR